MKKKWIAMALALTLVLPFTSLAAGTQQYQTADALNELDLFRGKGAAGYDLDANLTRAEGATLLVRMLGKDDVAENWTAPIPFRDVPMWAVGYVGYAAANNITNGTNLAKGEFSPDAPLSDYMFLTLVLRALDYSDQGTQPLFVWNDPYKLAAQVGLLDRAAADNNFTRGDAVEVLWNAMSVNLAGKNITLAQNLIKQDVFTKAEFAAAEKIQQNGRTENAGVLRPGNNVNTGSTNKGSGQQSGQNNKPGNPNAPTLPSVPSSGNNAGSDTPTLTPEKPSTGGEQYDPSENPGGAFEEGNTSQDTAFVLLETPIGDLSYPAKWEETVYAEEIAVGTGYTAEVYGQTESGKVRLFTLYIGTDTNDGFLVGYVGSRDVRAETEDLQLNGWATADENTVYSMQEDINYIFEQIMEMRGYTSNGAQNDDFTEEDFVLMNTSIGRLYYPGIWYDRAYAEEVSVSGGYAAEVYGKTESGEAVLYTLYIGTGTNDGFLVGYVGDKAIRLEIEELSLRDWSEEDEMAAYEMQEDMNYLIEQIRSMRGFSESAPVYDDDMSGNADFALLDTPIGTLYYPDRWEACVTAEETTAGEGYMAEVYGMTDSDEVKLFTLYFGTDTEAGFLLGYVGTQAVRAETEELSLHGWSEEDETAAYEMQEDMNYILEQIMDMDGFRFE